MICPLYQKRNWLFKPSLISSRTSQLRLEPAGRKIGKPMVDLHMVSELELDRMGMQVDFLAEIGLFIFAHIVID
jgi:hypothetical protein